MLMMKRYLDAEADRVPQLVVKMTWGQVQLETLMVYSGTLVGSSIMMN